MNQDTRDNSIQVGDFVKIKDLCVHGFVLRFGFLGGQRKWPAAILDVGGGREGIATLDDLDLIWKTEDLCISLDCTPPLDLALITKGGI